MKPPRKRSLSAWWPVPWNDAEPEIHERAIRESIFYPGRTSELLYKDVPLILVDTDPDYVVVVRPVY